MPLVPHLTGFSQKRADHPSLDYNIYDLQSNAKDVAKKGTELWKIIIGREQPTQ